MVKNDRILVFSLAVTAVMLLGLGRENARTLSRSATVHGQTLSSVDTEKIKADIERSGLMPREAKYWKTLRAE